MWAPLQASRLQISELRNNWLSLLFCHRRTIIDVGWHSLTMTTQSKMHWTASYSIHFELASPDTLLEPPHLDRVLPLALSTLISTKNYFVSNTHLKLPLLYKRSNRPPGSMFHAICPPTEEAQWLSQSLICSLFSTYWHYTNKIIIIIIYYVPYVCNNVSCTLNKIFITVKYIYWMYNT